MKIRDLMTRDVATCRTDTNLAAAGALMWQRGCGILPVVDDARKAIGVVTDRDICIALCTRNARSSDLQVGDVARSKVLSCTPNEDVRAALETMRKAKIHRLPVIDEAGVLEGIVSMDDIVMNVEKGNGKTELPYNDVLQTLQAISAHHETRPRVILTE